MGAISAGLSLAWDFLTYAFRPSSRVWPLYLVTMIPLAYLAHRQLRDREPGSFLSWAFPSETYRHDSHRTDLKLFALGQVLSVFGFFKLVAVTTTVATLTLALAETFIPRGPQVGPVVITLVLIAASDFSTYWVHRLHHENRRLWPFHAVHHSAEVMTPFTLYRKHPVYDLVGSASKGLLGGLAQGVLLAVFADTISVSLIAGINAGYFLFNIAGANLRHSHIWLGYGRLLSHVFISPAQHQIHHSLAPQHFNKNYGEVFAVWDWMFGTLYVPRGHEKIEFGLSDAEGNRVAQPHPDLRTALVVPFREALARPEPTAEVAAVASDDDATQPVGANQ